MHLKITKSNTSFILDNGAHTAKFALNLAKQPSLIPNCIMKVKSERRRPFIGDQINDCRDASGLFYILPFQRGYLVNWDVQKTVWDYIFSRDPSAKLTEFPVVLTEPVYNFQSNHEALNEIFFEEYECCALLKLTATDLCAYHYSKENDNCRTCIVIDSGYSFTHIVPYVEGKKYFPALKRIDVGGKVLTNHLKEIISYRQLHVMDETYVINQVKEDACFVSENFRNDMFQTAYRDERNKIITEYVLPDYSTIKRGYLRKISKFRNDDTEDDSEGQTSVEQQAVVLNNERITIPEILFHPSDIGIPQMGIAEALVDCVNSCPPEYIYQLLGNIVVTGAGTQFKHFSKRLYSEIRQRFDENLIVNIFTPPNPATYAWYGGKYLTTDPEYLNSLTKKEHYEERGHGLVKQLQDQFTLP